MSAHIDDTFTIKEIAFWQNVWMFLAKNDFAQLPDYLGHDEELLQLNDKTFTVSSPGFAIQLLTNFYEAPDLLKKLQTELHKQNYDVTLLEWNYLGKHSEKEEYINYLSETFWNYQNNESLQKIDNLLDVTENNWKIVNYTDSLSFYLHPPIDFFANDTVQFLEELEKDLHDWNLNPYLICENTGSFHWKMIVSDKFLLEGFIYKEDQYLIHQFEFKTL